MRRFTCAAGAAAALFLLASAPVHAAPFAEDTPTYITIPKPIEGTGVLVVVPDVTLNLLTAAGGQDPKAEWSDAARKHLNESVSNAIKTRKYTVSSIDLTTYQDPRAVQMLKLNAVVTDSIALNQFPMFKMPTKPTFDWTLGDGVSTLVPADASTPPAYALFLKARGSYSSGGRAAMMVGMAVLGVGIPMGGQQMQATLVDLKTGQVVWYKYMAVAAGTDIREADGAEAAVQTLIKQLPL